MDYLYNGIRLMQEKGLTDEEIIEVLEKFVKECESNGDGKC